MSKRQHWDPQLAAPSPQRVRSSANAVTPSPPRARSSANAVAVYSQRARRSENVGPTRVAKAVQTVHVGKPPFAWGDPNSRARDGGGTVNINFHQLHAIDFTRVESKTSPSFECGGVRWRVELDFRGVRRGGSATAPDVGIAIKMDSGELCRGDEYSVMYTVTIPKLGYCRTSSERATRPGTDCRRLWPKCFNSKDMVNRGIQNGTLHIQVKFDRLVRKHHRWTPTLAFNREKLKMLRAERQVDVTFVVGQPHDQTRIRANSALVLLGAPGLQAIIDLAPVSSDGRRRVALPMVDPEDFRDMLRFVYADDTSFLADKTSQTDMLDQLSVAVAFGCWKLKVLLEIKLATNHLHVNSCVDLLLFADEHSCSILKEECIKVVGKNLSEVFRRGRAGDLIQAVGLMEEIHQCASGRVECQADGDKFDGMRIDELYEWLERRNDVVLDRDMDRTSLLANIRSLVA